MITEREIRNLFGQTSKAENRRRKKKRNFDFSNNDKRTKI